MVITLFNLLYKKNAYLSLFHGVMLIFHLGLKVNRTTLPQAEGSWNITARLKGPQVQHQTKGNLGSACGYFFTFPCHNPLPSPRLQAAAQQRAIALPGAPYRGCQMLPTGVRPRAEAYAGQLKLGPSTGLKPSKPSSDQGKFFGPGVLGQHRAFYW